MAGMVYKVYYSSSTHLQCSTYSLFTKGEDKVAETLSRSIKAQTRITGQYPVILTEQGWTMKDLLHGHKDNVFLRD